MRRRVPFLRKGGGGRFHKVARLGQSSCARLLLTTIPPLHTTKPPPKVHRKGAYEMFKMAAAVVRKLFGDNRIDIRFAPQPFHIPAQPNRGYFAREAWTMRQQKQKRRLSSSLSVETEMPAILFDLDGTLVDSNYQHVNASTAAS